MSKKILKEKVLNMQNMSGKQSSIPDTERYSIVSPISAAACITPLPVSSMSVAACIG
ncbi:hypothetical protein V5G65_14990 [Mammaliicoccus sciuri]|uniref:hypothetical protein n=1 Tax=Mammaliicoccus sciuri TaxID=1296 RepID=UPI003799F78A